MKILYVKRTVLVLALLVLVVEGYFAYQWYDRYYGVVPDAASGGGAPLEVAGPDGTDPGGPTAKRDVPSDADRGEAAARQDEAEYLDAVADIQARAVDAFLDSHSKLLRYDALADDDIEEMKANAAALQEMADEAAGLAPPKEYEEQHEVFGSAIVELRNAAGLAHGAAADPVAATEVGFDEYDGRVDEASDLLRRSNERLGQNYKVIGDVREVSPEF